MWVFCCGMYRSASTLQFQITTQLVSDNGVGRQVGWIDADRFANVRVEHQNVSELKVVKVHRCTEPMQAEFARGTAIGIYAFRDVRDVYASMLTQKQKPFEWLWQEGFLRECLDHYHRWTTQPNVLVSAYQEILADPAREVKRIANHLGISIDLDSCQEIANNYSIAAQKERIDSFKEKLFTLQRSPNDHRELIDYHDETSLLHMNHIDAVKTGRWRDDLSNHEVRTIETEVKQWCKETGYEPSIFLS